MNRTNNNQGRKGNNPSTKRPKTRSAQSGVAPKSRSQPRPRRSLDDGPPPTTQVGAVVRSRLTRTGVSDIRNLRVAWTAGYTYVGNGTVGIANKVYFQTRSQAFIIVGNDGGASGQVPIASSDPDVGASYLADIEKHFSRKVIKRMWVHVNSLQPSTANNMVAIFGASRGPGGMAASIPDVSATVNFNTVDNVLSMKGSFPIDSWEHRTEEITAFIAGGAGSRQNEFEIQSAPKVTNGIYGGGAGNAPTIDGDTLIPACFAIAGNSTTAALQGTQVHQVVFEQEIDLLDYIGGMAQVSPTD